MAETWPCSADYSATLPARRSRRASMLSSTTASCRNSTNATAHWPTSVLETGSPLRIRAGEIANPIDTDGTFNPKVLGSIPSGVNGKYWPRMIALKSG